LKRSAGDGECNWTVPAVEQGKFLGDKANTLTVDGKLILEAFEFDRASTDISSVSAWIAEHALPSGDEHKFFRDKLRDHLVVLNDTDFSHFVQNSTVVEPHVRINNETGTAESGGLFYTENLPPESLLVGQVLATIERRKSKDSRNEPLKDAAKILEGLLAGGGKGTGIDGKLIQMGGDATTGRGLLMLHAVQGGK
jgi:CRISPR-associated protein Cmr4